MSDVQAASVAAPTNGASAPPTNRAEQLDAVTELLNPSTGDETPPAAGDQTPPAAAAAGDAAASAGDETPPAAAPITSFKELAEAAGVEMTQLYELTVGLGDGSEPMKLGAMKDAIKQGIEVESRESNLADERTALQNEVMRARAEIKAAAEAIQLTPEQLTRARDNLEASKQREQAALFQAVPQLGNDPEFARATHVSVTALAAEYGVAGHAVDRMRDTDHISYKMAMDFAALRERVSKANAVAKKVRKGSSAAASNATGKSAGNSKALGEQAIKSGLVNDQVAAVASILGEQ